MRKFLSLIALCLFLCASCSDDDSNSTKKTKQIENDIIGIWIPNYNVQSTQITNVVFYFNKDKTGSIHQILGVDNDGFIELNDGTKMKNIRFEEYLPEQTHGQVHKLLYEDPDRDNRPGEYIVHYVSSDSLAIQLSTVSVFRKVSSLNVK